VLLVEDDATVRQLTRKTLVRLGYRVLDAASSAAARELAKVYVGSIDLLLADLLVPGTAARELAAALRAERPKLRVLFMSGTGDLDALEDIPDPGCASIQKPFSSLVLAHKLRALLDP